VAITDSCGCNQNQSAEVYDRLVAYANEWFERKPEAFFPIFKQDPSAEEPPSKDGPKAALGADFSRSQFFPTIWYLSDAINTGLQFYHLTRILPHAFDPRTPRTGPSRIKHLQAQTKHIQCHLRTLVSIGRGNPHCLPNFVLAVVGVGITGDRCEERGEHKELLKFLLVCDYLRMFCPVSV
jgi:hypothetical protein